MEVEETYSPILGFYFRCEDPDLEVYLWQGKILSVVEPSYYLIEEFSFETGERIAHHIVCIDDMTEWKLYGTREEFDRNLDQDLVP